MFSQPVSKYDSFIVDDQPGEQWISLKRQYGDSEDITIEATMFDGAVPRSKADVIEGEEAMQLHITIFVNISKKETSDVLEFVCSAFPDTIEIRRLYTRSSKKMPPQVYPGPEFKYVSYVYLLLHIVFFFVWFIVHMWIDSLEIEVEGKPLEYIKCNNFCLAEISP